MMLLITGGAGFIGSAVVRHILTNTATHVVNVDALTYAGNLESLADVASDKRYTFEHVNICHRQALARVFRQYQPDAVMHLAAESHVDRSIHGPDAFIQTNVVGTSTLLEVAREYWQSLEGKRRAAFRFHHVSTDEVYGDLSPADPAFTEATPYAPSSPYSASKAASDHLVRAWHRTYGLPVLITNCSNNYGPYQFPEKLIPLMILNALAGQSLPVYGKGDNVRDWLYVEDHARALHHVLQHGQPGRTYNIGGRSERTNLEVVHALCTTLDELVPLTSSPSFCAQSQDPKTAPRLDSATACRMTAKGAAITSYAELIEFVTDRPGHDRRYAIDDTRLTTELGWQPQESFDTGLRKTIQWYLDNPQWVAHVRSGTYREWLDTNYTGREAHQ